MLALIDSDIVAYRAAFAAEKVIYNAWFAEDLCDGGRAGGTTFALAHPAATPCDGQVRPLYVANSKAELTELVGESGRPLDAYLVERSKILGTPETARMAAKASMEAILSELAVNDYCAYLTGRGNYRESLATIKPYKGHRPEKPVYLPLVRDYLVQVWGAKIVDDMEADDMLGIEQCQNPGNTIICSIDKDLDMIPGLHYNFVKNEKYFISEVTGIRNFYKQMLTGDTTDNIPGLYHLTRKKCTKDVLGGLDDLTSESAMFTYVWDMYEAGLLPRTGADSPMHKSDASLTAPQLEDYLLEIGRLLWIRRTPNELWTFPA